MAVETSVHAFVDLDAPAAYELWRLRQDVFVVEQACAYADLDGRDLEASTRHVLLHVDGTLAGCARILDEVEEWRVGRVALAQTARGQGLADVLVLAALTACPDRSVVLDAQAPLARWYSTFGFAVSGPGFVEDGIPHLPMSRPAVPRSGQTAV